MRIHRNGTQSSSRAIFEINDNTDVAGTAWIRAASTSGQMAGLYGGENPSAYKSGGTTDAWTNVAYSINHSTGDHAVYNGGAWNEDTAEINTAALIDDITKIVLGNSFATQGTGSVDNPVYIDRFAIVSGYQAATPTNW
jgi:hypothetical protein